MKKSLKVTAAFLFVGLASFSTMSCNKIKDAIKVNVPVTMSVPITIPAVAATGSTTSQTMVVKANIDSIINASNSKLSAENIKSVSIKSLNITINEDSHFDQDNFTAVANLTEHFYSDGNPTKIELAQISNPTDPYSIDIPVSTPGDLKGYFNDQTFYFQTDLKMKRATTHEINAVAKVTFTVQAGL